MNAKQILAAWLSDHGYDGLYLTGDHDCACVVTDLMPCGECPDTCRAGKVRVELQDGKTYLRIGPSTQNVHPGPQFMGE